MTAAAGLITVRFDLAGSDVGRWYRSAQGAHASGRPHFSVGRLYTVEDATPRHLAWYETVDPVRPSEAGAWLSPAARAQVDAAEIMSFALKRDVGDKAADDTPFLYIVHTDVPDDIVDEYNAWYDEEHLPRLVTVPGVLRARRYTAVEGHPRYLTAYALTDKDAFSSPEGLKARKTPWTEKMRSLFSNTRRLMGALAVPGAG
jgi:hypothetical protein